MVNINNTLNNEKTIPFTFPFFCWLPTCAKRRKTVDLKNDPIRDVIFKKIDTRQDHITYELKIKQPIDHSDPSKGFFYQKAYLTHKGFDRPTVIITEGYNRDQNRVYELTDLLQANQLNVLEHRFFGESMPQPADYTYLNLRSDRRPASYQATVWEIYSKKWVSTGISKGATTIFYRYFYPLCYGKCALCGTLKQCL